MRRTEPQSGYILGAYCRHLLPKRLWYVIRGLMSHWMLVEENLVEKQPQWAGIIKNERERRSWTQSYLATKVGVDPKTVSRWETGQSYPRSYQRQKFVELFGRTLAQLGFADTDIIDVDEHAQMELSPSQAPLFSGQPLISTSSPAIWGGEDASRRPRLPNSTAAWPLLEDWESAPLAERFYGRSSERETLASWVLENRCRMVLVLGIGGVGKTTFATRVARDIKYEFEYIFWRSLRNAPPLEQFLDSCLQFMRAHQQPDLARDLDGQIALLLAFLREHRCLLLFDNVESIFQEGQYAGRYTQEHSGYGRLFASLGEAEHQSCLLLTSRETLPEVVRMKGNTAPVRVLPLVGVSQDEGQDLLSDQDLHGASENWRELVRLYAGNPLALKLVAEPIRAFFDGDIADFLLENDVIPNDITNVLEQQFRRLSPSEQQVLYWLAIEREPVTRNMLRADLRQAVVAKTLLDTCDSLHRRSLIEKLDDGSFTLQPVVSEYVIQHFVTCICQEILSGPLDLLSSHALIKAQAHEYIRVSQQRQILARVAQGLRDELNEPAIVARLKGLLPALRGLPERKAGYAAGNILNLLVLLGADLRGLDCSALPIWQAYLQGVSLADVNFAHADLTTSVFTDTFSSILCLAVSPDGTMLAAGTTTNELRLWWLDGMVPLFSSSAHTDGLRAVAFSPDGRLLASASEDETIRLWDTETYQQRQLLHGHTSWVRAIAFSPDSRLLVSASEDTTVCVWDISQGVCLKVLSEHTMRVRAVVFSPNGWLVASGGDDGTIRLWDTETWTCCRILRKHTNLVRGLAFHPSGETLISASEDKTVRIWRMPTGECLHTLQGHSSRVSALALFSAAGLLASCGDDHTIRLWDANTGQCQKILHDHTNRIWALTVVPGQDTLISASEDQTLRFWSVRAGVCTRTIQGSTSLVKAVAISPDGRLLASATEEQIVQVWDSERAVLQRTLSGHANRVRCVAFSPDGQMIASGSEDQTLRLWNVRTGQCVKTLLGHTHLVRGVVFTPGGARLLSCGYDQTVRLWDVQSGRCQIMQGHVGIVWAVACSRAGGLVASGGEDRTICLWDIEHGECLTVLRGHEHRIWSLAFSPNGNLLASASDDATIRIWELTTGKCLHVLRGHSAWTRAVAWSPYGDVIASGSHDKTVRLWDARSGQHLRTLNGHSHCVWTVVFHPSGHRLASAGDDGRILYWDVATGDCLNEIGKERLYEQMNISNVRGLVETQKLTLISLGARDENDVFDSEV
jgi:WD40 repeat protein/transcriptional regulator with XRE-family HTH domain